MFYWEKALFFVGRLITALKPDLGSFRCEEIWWSRWWFEPWWQCCPGSRPTVRGRLQHPDLQWCPKKVQLLVKYCTIFNAPNNAVTNAIRNSFIRAKEKLQNYSSSEYFKEGSKIIHDLDCSFCNFINFTRRRIFF